MTDAALTDADREHFDKVARKCVRPIIGLVGRSIYVELVDRIADALAEEAKLCRSQIGEEP